MAYILGVVLVVVFFTVLHFFTELSTKQKGITTAVLASFILGAYLYNQNTENRRLLLENILLEYQHDKEIVCADIKVSNKEFSYSSGTQTFLGLKDTPSYGRIISLDKCK